MDLIRGHVTNIISPDHKRRIREEQDKDESEFLDEYPPPQVPQRADNASVNSQVHETSSSNYDTDDDTPLSSLFSAQNNTDDRTRRLLSRNANKGRMGRIKRIVRRRLTPKKHRATKKDDPLSTISNAPPQKPTVNPDCYSVLEKIQEDIRTIKLDGNRLGEIVQGVQKEIACLRTEMVTKEGIDACLSSLTDGIGEHLSNHKNEIDYNRSKIVDLDESVLDLKAAIETCQVTTDEHGTRITSLEGTVVKDLNVFRKELEGFDDRLSKKVPPVPFLPESHLLMGKKTNATDNQNAQQVGVNKSVIIEGLYEFPLENLEERVAEVMDQIGVVLHEADYNKIERLGSWNQERSWPRPIKIELMAEHKKAKILAAKDHLANTADFYRISIKPDEAKHIRVARAKIRQTAKQARAEGKQVKQTPDYVIVNGVKYDLETVLKISDVLEGTLKAKVGEEEEVEKKYPETNRYAENLCLLDTPRGMAFFTIRCKLSNFYPSSFTYNGRRFETAEHAYQAEKALTVKDFLGLRKILRAPNAKLAKKWGGDVSTSALWERIKVDRMRSILNAKFRQNSDLADYLCSFKGKPLIEGSWDGFWGAGAPLDSTNLKNGNWTGQNHLGRLLTELKDH